MRRAHAVILTERNRAPVLEEIEVDEPGAGEVLVRLHASGICHTDVAALRDARSYPVVLGHEGAGVVAAVGPGVSHVAPGDHVIINWQPKCGRCVRCRSDRSDLCEHVVGTEQPRVFWRGRPLAVLLQAGTFCAFAVVPAGGAVPIRRDIAFEEAALIGCGVATGVGAALFTAKLQAGDTAVVIGAGGVGLNIVQGARLAGASRILAVDIDPAQQVLARELGATHTLDGRDAELVEKARAITGGRGWDFVFEVVGLPALMRAGVDLLARGGELVLVGAAARDAEFSFAPRRFMSCQQSIRGSIYGNIRPARHLPMFADWCCEGRLHVGRLITHRVRLEEVPALIAAPERLRGTRTVITWPESSGA